SFSSLVWSGGPIKNSIKGLVLCRRHGVGLVVAAKAVTCAVVTKGGRRNQGEEEEERGWGRSAVARGYEVVEGRDCGGVGRGGGWRWLVVEDERRETDISSFIKNGVCSSSSVRILKGSNIVLSKYANNAQVIKADFIKSSVNTEDCPNDGSPEFALVGRSNVGKSSLLNSIVRRKKLALTSKKPGKTQCINHFRINDSWYLVDLPGYGYAQAPGEVRVEWDKFTKNYFMNRTTLVSVFLLIDASIPAKKMDLEYASWLGKNKIPMTLVFTKCDKRKKKKNGGKRPEENVEDFQELIREYFETAPPWIMTSSVTNQGRDEILLHMAQLRNYWLKH
ncbi:hypothetical protein KSS87_013901, partial [Heliosperma pusillum]